MTCTVKVYKYCSPHLSQIADWCQQEMGFRPYRRQVVCYVMRNVTTLPLDFCRRSTARYSSNAATYSVTVNKKDAKKFRQAVMGFDFVPDPASLISAAIIFMAEAITHKESRCESVLTLT